MTIFIAAALAGRVLGVTPDSLPRRPDEGPSRGRAVSAAKRAARIRLSVRNVLSGRGGLPTNISGTEITIFVMELKSKRAVVTAAHLETICPLDRLLLLHLLTYYLQRLGGELLWTVSEAVGPLSVATGTRSSAFGVGASAEGSSSTALGNNASATASGGIAVGDSSSASGSSATPVGVRANASGTFSVATGVDARATGVGSVALGAGSIADQDNVVSVGAAGAERRIVNLAAGVARTDAVNVGQLQGVEATANTALANAGRILIGSPERQAGTDPQGVRPPSRRPPQTEKLLPQPQPEAAFGFLTWKAEPPSDST